MTCDSAVEIIKFFACVGVAACGGIVGVLSVLAAICVSEVITIKRYEKSLRKGSK